MRNALLSVYNKAGIVEFARSLLELDFRLFSSGGTARVLREAGLAVTDVAEIIQMSHLRLCRTLLADLGLAVDDAALERAVAGVGKPILGDRVKTLSREVHAGLLAREVPEDIEELERLGIPRIDLVCVDLYPLEAEIAREGSTSESVIELTDIGGPTMLRSAAKGRRIVICHADQRENVLQWLRDGMPDASSVIRELVAAAEGIVARYCLASARYHSKGEWDGMIGHLARDCKYGENAWQTPTGLFSTGTDDPLALDRFSVVEGTAPSYNNWCDVDRLLQTATHVVAGATLFVNNPLVAVAVKHGNPCGASVGTHPKRPAEILSDALLGAPVSVFGGVLMTNFPLTNKVVGEVLDGWGSDENRGKLMLDGIVAPAIEPEAIHLMSRKTGKCRFLVNPALADLGDGSLDVQPRRRYARGGFLRQPNYTHVLRLVGVVDDWTHMNLTFAWAIGATSNSNTITLVNNGTLIGNGVGQQDRVTAAELAIKRARDAGHETRGSVAYSDSFFPFEDGPEALADAGVSAIFASSGSIRDAKVRETLESRGVRILMLPDSEVRGFFGH